MSLKTFPQKSWTKCEAPRRCAIYFIAFSVPCVGSIGCLPCPLLVITPFSLTEWLFPQSMRFCGAANHNSLPLWPQSGHMSQA